MKCDTVLILDDVSSLADLVKSRLHAEFGSSVRIRCFKEERPFKLELDRCEDEHTLVFINATFKPFPTAHRYEFSGLQRTTKRGLRITWLRRTPVIVYGSVAKDDLLRQGIGSLLVSNASHSYLEICQLKGSELKTVIESMQPIADKEKLKGIINSFCADELSRFILSAEHQPLSKSSKLNSASGRRDISQSLSHLQEVLPENCSIDTALLQRTIDGLEAYDPLRKKEIQDDLASIRNGLRAVSSALRG